MSLVEMIDGLIDDIGTGLNEATIRSRLLTMREQAEAVDTALKKGEAALEECNSALHDACSDLERLKSDAQQENLPHNEEAVLQLLAHAGGTSWVSEVKIQHHADKLEAKGCVVSGLSMLRNGRTHVMISLTAKGREYIAKKSLA